MISHLVGRNEKLVFEKFEAFKYCSSRDFCISVLEPQTIKMQLQRVITMSNAILLFVAGGM